MAAFGVNRSTPSGRQDYCKTCYATRDKDKFWATVHRYEQILHDEYSMTPGEYLDLWRQQRKQCPICDAPLILYSRNTRIRIIGTAKRLLCVRCDRGMSGFNNDLKRLERAVELLR